MTEMTMYQNKTDGLSPKFYHEQSVDIISGFYRGNYGTVTGYMIKDKKILYNIDISELNIVLLVAEDDLRERKNKSFIKKFFRR